MDNDEKNSAIDFKILTVIDATRAEHQACTARRVADVMHLSPTAIHARMQRMRGQYVDWNKLQGSVHLLPAGEERIAEWKASSSPTNGDGLPTGDAATTMRDTDDATVDVEQIIAAATSAAVHAALAAVGITGVVAAQEEAGSHEPPTSEQESPGETPDTDPGSESPSPSDS